MKPKIIAIVGPTASGKSSLGIYLAQKLNGEVISADSRQVYKGLNIGTGKVTKREMSGVPHHLLDVASPKKQFTVDDFVCLAQKAHSNILQNDRISIVVGGTGFYVDALLGNFVLPNVPPNPTLRKELDQKDVYTLFAMLEHLDPRRAETIEPHHKRRIIRAIEIAQAIGQSPIPQGDILRKYDVLWLGISPTSEKLKQKIQTRLFARIKAGMITEAKRLHKQGLSYKRMEELGLEYRSLSRFLQKKISRKELEVEIENGNWHYAKRQRTWFKRNKDIIWVANKSEALRLAKAFLSR